MTRSILRIVLTTLALVMLFAGSLNLNRTSANEPAGGGICAALDCPVAGPNLCAYIETPNGSLTCFMP